LFVFLQIMPDEPSYDDAEKWAKKTLGKKDPEQLALGLHNDDVGRMNLYASYAQYLTAKSLEKSSRRIERFTAIMIFLTVLVGYFAIFPYFVPIVGLPLATSLAAVLLFVVFIVAVYVGRPKRV